MKYKIGDIILVQSEKSRKRVDFVRRDQKSLDLFNRYLPYKVVGVGLSGYDYTILVTNPQDGWPVASSYPELVKLGLLGKRIWHIEEFMIKGLAKKTSCKKCLSVE